MYSFNVASLERQLRIYKITYRITVLPVTTVLPTALPQKPIYRLVTVDQLLTRSNLGA